MSAGSGHWVRNYILAALAGAVVAGAVGIGGALVVIEGGLFNSTATTPHSAIVGWAAHTAFKTSVRRDAGSSKAPTPFTNEQVAAGLQVYEQNCVMCHGGPATPRAAFVAGMIPTPPYLLDAARRWSPTQLHWIVAQGIKMTAMPAWTETLSDAEIWSVVAFLDALPGMPPSKYLDMRSKLAQGPETPTQEAAR